MSILKKSTLRLRPSTNGGCQTKPIVWVSAVSSLRSGLPPWIAGKQVPSSGSNVAGSTPIAFSSVAQFAARVGEPRFTLSMSQGSCARLIEMAVLGSNSSPMFGARTADDTVPLIVKPPAMSQMSPASQVPVVPIVE